LKTGPLVALFCRLLASLLAVMPLRRLALAAASGTRRGGVGLFVMSRRCRFVSRFAFLATQFGTYCRD